MESKNSKFKHCEMVAEIDRIDEIPERSLWAVLLEVGLAPYMYIAIFLAYETPITM
jgi:hypothetical protein